MNLATLNPYFITFDSDGSPLNNGYMYFGAVGLDGQINPATVYWDAAGLMPAPQPIRTLNGMPYNGVRPAQIFAAGEVSVKILDSNGAPLNFMRSTNSWQMQASASQLQAELLDPSGGNGAAMVAKGVIAAAVGTVGRALDVSGLAVPVGADLSAAFTVVAAGGVIQLEAGTYSTLLNIPAKVMVRGQGEGRTIIQIPSGGTANVVTLSGAGAGISECTIDYTGGGAGSGGCIFASGVGDIRIINVSTKGSKGIGVWVYNAPRYRINGLHNSGSADWGVLIDGPLTVDGIGYDITNTNCTNRGLMMRGVTRCMQFGVVGNGNGASSIWMLDCIHSHAFGCEDYNDMVGDAFVIEGASIGSTIVGVSGKTCGGHTASISSSATAAPVDCHIRGVFSDGAGESIAVISDQGSGFQPTNCTITGINGKNCGRVTPSEGFGFGNAVNCRIEGYITDSVGTMTYAVRESGASPSNNTCEIRGWVTGTLGYFQLSSSTSQIIFDRIEGRVLHKGDVDYTWNPAVDGTEIIYDLAALTAARAFTLLPGWQSLKVRVSRPATGAFALSIKQGVTTLKTLNAGEWADFVHDGSNWNPSAKGTM